MRKFTASNGITVEALPENGVRIALPSDGHGDSAKVNHPAPVTQALREFFRAEEDERLGRWRWPENPDYVVYPAGDGVVDVIREASVSQGTRGPGLEAGITRNAASEWDREVSRNFYMAARAYFDAHPEPKPWHNAKPGELWILTVDGEEQEAFAHQMPHHQTVMFQTKHRSVFGAEGTAITAGRRIWPEDAS